MAGLRNVLLVEDDVIIRDLYRSALVHANYTVEGAGGAAEAYQKLATYRPDVVFLDIMMPLVSGLEVLKELRTNPVHNCMEVRIVMLTNMAQRSVIDNAMQNGADGFIIKSDILPSDLAKVIVSLEEDDKTTT